jgi:hypothetical protein
MAHLLKMASPRGWGFGSYDAISTKVVVKKYD